MIIGCPLLVVVFNYIIQELHGDIPTTVNEINTHGLFDFIVERCVLNNLPTLTHYLMIFAFYILQIVLYYIVPGAPAVGPATPTGYVPKYKENGVSTYIISILLVLAAYFMFNIPVHDMYHHLTPLIIAVCILAWIATFVLMFCAMCCPENPLDTVWASNPILSYWRGLVFPKSPICFPSECTVFELVSGV